MLLGIWDHMNSFSFEYFEIIQVIRYLERVRMAPLEYIKMQNNAHTCNEKW
jgi:hypothetical protein